MTKNNLASFQIRLLAWFIDFLLEVVILLVYISILVSQPKVALAVSVGFGCLLFFLNPIWMFKSIWLTYFFGGSFGKLITGLRVTNEHEKQLSFRRIAFRQTIGYSFASLIFGLGYLIIIKDKKRQGWHDQAVGSLVVEKSQQWIAGAIVCILLLFASFYLVNQSITKFSTSPMRKELPRIGTNLQTILEDNQPSTNHMQSSQNQKYHSPTGY